MPKRSDRPSNESREPEKPRRWPAHLDPDPDDVGDATDEEWDQALSRDITVSELRRLRTKAAEPMDEPFIADDTGGKVFKVRDPYPDHDPDGEAGHYWEGDEISAGNALIIAAESVGMNATVNALGRYWLHREGPEALIEAAGLLTQLAKRRQRK